MKKFYLFVLALVLFFAGTGAMHITKNEPKPAKQLYCCAEQIETDCSECSVCVVGKASKMIVANSAVCFVRIENCDENIFTSQTSCKETYQNIISKAERFGISKDSFIEHEMTSRHGFSNPKEYKTFIDFEIQISDTDKIQSLSEEISGFENCKILDLHYVLSNISEEYESVLNEAIENANQKANEILKREGQDAQIIAKNIFSISDQSNSQPQIEIRAVAEILYK